jgi:large subunit ribosomal protein L24
MKNKFSTKWKGSKQPRKKRKYQANAPLHIKKNFLIARMSKELRKRYEKTKTRVRKGDKVRIMKGEFKKKEGKITNVFMKISKITVEGIQRKKRDGSKVDVKIYPSNTQIIELDLNDKNREKILIRKENTKSEMKKETRQVDAKMSSTSVAEFKEEQKK